MTHTSGPSSDTATVVPVSLGLVYSRSLDGHRGNYVQLFTKNLGMAPAVGPMSSAMMWRLIVAKQLCFAMIEDSATGFLVVSAARAACGRPTFALLLRPQTCFEGRSARHLLKRWSLAIWRCLPGISIATILPFEVDPENRRIATTGLHDPELWDLIDNGCAPVPPRSSLADEIFAEAAGRSVVVMLGALSRAKGFDAFVRLAQTKFGVREDRLYVAAGQLNVDSDDLAAELKREGGLVFGRRLTEEEIHSLYSVADRIWACYSAEYDQSSGIFGRAVQYGVVPIVRVNSRIHRFALIEGLEVETLDFETGLLAPNLGQTHASGIALNVRLQGWRDRFWNTARGSLTSNEITRGRE